MEKLHPKSFICRRIYIGKTQNYQELTLGHIKMITWVSTLLHSHRSTTIREGQTQWWDSYTSVYDFWYLAWSDEFFLKYSFMKNLCNTLFEFMDFSFNFSLSFTLQQRAQYLLNLYLWIKQSLKEWLKNYVNILHTKLYFLSRIIKRNWSDISFWHASLVNFESLNFSKCNHA